MGQLRFNLSSEAQEMLDAFCEASGASRSDVVSKLIEEYMGELAAQVAALVESEDEEEAEEAESDEEEDADEDEEEEEV